MVYSQKYLYACMFSLFTSQTCPMDKSTQYRKLSGYSLPGNAARSKEAPTQTKMSWAWTKGKNKTRGLKVGYRKKKKF